MPGRRSGFWVLVNFTISKPRPLPPSGCWPILLGPGACPAPPFCLLASVSLPGQPLRLKVSRLRALPPGGERTGDICGPQARKRTKETQPYPALRFPQNSSASRGALAAAAASSGSSESRSETPTANGWSRARWPGVFARGGRRQRQVKIRLASELRRDVCHWRPPSSAGAAARTAGWTRGGPGTRARDPGEEQSFLGLRHRVIRAAPTLPKLSFLWISVERLPLYS